MVKDLDFLEIGTSNFDTLIEQATDDTVGMSVEPIRHYLESLPEKANVTKVNAAIKAGSREDTCLVYYIPEDVIAKNNLPSFMKGCNAINCYHLQHSLFNVEELVVKEEIEQISIVDLLKKHNIRKIKFLKIDTEGGDGYILLDLYEYLKDVDKVFYPDRILFESNSLVSPSLVDEVVDKYNTLGYIVESRNLDTVLVLR